MARYWSRWRPFQWYVLSAEHIARNPSDYNEWRLKRGGVCHEGCGVVVASGGGFLANRLVGRPVGVMLTRSGTAAEYLCCDASKDVFTLPVSDNVALADCASWFINPFTALSILDTAKTKHQANVLIQTAASSQLGQMLIKLAPSQGMTLVNVVRKKEHWSMLKSMGATHVICTADEDWMSQLKALVKTLDIKVAFDAVAGDMTGSLMTCLPSRSVVYVYGVLSGIPVGKVEPIDLIYRRKQVAGFHVAKDWLSVGGQVAMLSRVKAGIQLVGSGLSPGGWATSQFTDCNMDSMHETFCDLTKSGFTGKKLRIIF
eukprot:scaffold1953_cov176-Amphora_coffeaeformis.AAC.58